MAAPSRPPRQRSSGGRTLMLLGVLLALAAGTIVIYIVSQATGTSASSVTVVVAAKSIPAGTELLAAPPTSGNTTGTMLVADAFVTKNVNSDFAPPDAFVFTNQQALNLTLNDHVVISDIFTGEILRQSDPRVVELGSAPSGSITLFNPGKLPAGDVLFGLATSSNATQGDIKAGDVIDVLVTECNLPGSQDTH